MISESLKKVVQPRSAECLVMNDGLYVAVRPIAEGEEHLKGSLAGQGVSRKDILKDRITYS